jgi:cell division transport system ATP-binding protein
MIKFENVTVCYNPHSRHPDHAVEDITLNIEKGEWVFLVGHSGAGKSTLIKLLHGNPHTVARGVSISGKVLLEGTDITHLPAGEVPFLRRKIGVIFQDFQLLAQKTAWENVAFALRVIGAPQQRIAREVPRALETVGLLHRAQAHPHQLSGGEQQRVAIARAIVNEPYLLLADEPTGNLDPETAAGIAAVLERINAERGTTVVMATHDHHLVDTLQRRVVRLREGRIISDEEHGIYHPEDDIEPAQKDAESTSKEETAAKPKQDSGAAAFGGESLQNEAPLGTPENPIPQFTRPKGRP